MFGMGVQSAFPSASEVWEDSMNSSGSLIPSGDSALGTMNAIFAHDSAKAALSGEPYSSWVKTPEDRQLYDIYRMQMSDSVTSAQQKLQDELTLMDRAYELNQKSRKDSWKADIEGMKAAGINPAAYFARNGSFSAPTVSAGSAAQASIPDLNMSSYLSSKYSSDSSAKAARFAATTQLIGTLLNTTGTLLFLAGKK